ncbi:serine hydrolase domain-containing protein [Micromonospora sp. M12]
MSKSFTAAAVMSLVDEGRVALDQPVVTYLPEFRMADQRAGLITVRQLLNQTSGLSDRTVDIGATQRATSLAGYLVALRHGTLTGEPGSHWEYCNVNYDVAARLVEVVDGRDFTVAMRDRIFGRLGMAPAPSETERCDRWTGSSPSTALGCLGRSFQGSGVVPAEWSPPRLTWALADQSGRSRPSGVDPRQCGGTPRAAAGHRLRHGLGRGGREGPQAAGALGQPVHVHRRASGGPGHRLRLRGYDQQRVAA